MPTVAKTRHIIPISGKDSLCTVIVQRELKPGLPYEFLFCDVGMELPETYAWLAEAEKYLGQEIVRIGKSLEGVIAEYNILPSHQRRFCTKDCKIFPIRDYVNGDNVVQYIGIRADEADRIVGGFERANVEYRYPLRDLGFDIQGVYKLLDSKGILPPTFFWKRLWDKVYEQVSEWARKWMDALPPWVKNGLFAWRSRGNCYMCFYQRLYELVGLLEHHPDLFTAAEKLEYDYGSMESRKDWDHLKADFYFKQGWPLPKIRTNADRLFSKRVDAVTRAVVSGAFHADDDEVDGLQLVSCGIYCGK